MMVAIRSRFGPWLPDVPPFGSEGSRVIKNALPVAGGYIPARQVSPFTESVTEDVLAAVYAVSSSGAAFGFVGTPNALRKANGNAFANVSKAGGFQTLDGDSWYFVRFGDLVIATNFNDPAQKFDLGADTVFSDLSTDAPKAKFLAVFNRFLFLGHLNENGTVSPSGVRWSALDVPTSFPAIDILTNSRSDEAVQTLSDRQILASEYGDITGLASGLTSADGVIFQENGITAVNFRGGDEIFAFDVIEGARGSIAPRSIVQEGGRAFYMSDTGLFFTDGISSTPLGANRVDDFLFEAIRNDQLDRIESGIDVRGKFLYWTLPGNGDLSLVYSYAVDEFALLEGLGVRLFVRSLNTATGLEDVAAQFGGLDRMTVSLDDPIFSGSRVPTFSAFDRDNKLGTLSGPALPATLRTKEAEIFDDGRAYMQFARPFIDTDQVSVRSVTRETLQDQPAEGVSSRVVAGTSRHRETARYWALQIETDAGADWTFAQGIQGVFEEAGNRDPVDIAVSFIVPAFLLIRQGLLLLDHDGRPLLSEEQLDPGEIVAFLVTLDGDRLVTLAGDPLITSV
ncbi:MAG: hypothetical protein HC871_12925 [Rhizobiales bacterium]|nr:hypothetical protein [Hyphomicrobiales bacterium]